MARTKAQKIEIVEKLKSMMTDAKSLVFVNFHGMKMADTTEFRKKLKSEGTGFFVAKKSLTERALADQKYDGSQPALIGEFGMAYGTDLIAPARGVYEFQKKLKDQVSIVGGVFEGRFMTKEDMIGIASIPPMQTLYGMFLNVINSPIQGLVMALDQISKKKTA